MGIEILQLVLDLKECGPEDRPTQRLRAALCGGCRPSALDVAVLLRHALRYHSLHAGAELGVHVPENFGGANRQLLESCGLRLQNSRGGWQVRADPWTPDWLGRVPAEGVDGSAAAAWERQVFETAPGDPLLSSFRRSSYRSHAQRAAVRAALTTPPGHTLLVCLPTGEGKSFVFQAFSKWSTAGAQGEGVTLVVVPTVALALDQERASREVSLPEIPRAYIGGQAETNSAILQRISSGTQGLCFASPEAICGPMRVPLLDAARGGHLRGVVIDEAHMVDSWGANFRPEFQVVSGVRLDLMRAAPPQSQPRTLLLSATLTGETVSTLRRFFAADADGNVSSDTFQVCASARIRPEIEYWVCPCTDWDEREPRIVEALRHLPRPAILYVTEVKHAKSWSRLLKGEGFARIAEFTGDTPPSGRDRIINQWRCDQLDLVVATSAFGLGIDKPDVRCVVHACLPETLDRFYQEVGRGGRDGRASLSLLMSTPRDEGIAESLNQPKKITAERGLARWRSMFHHPSRRDNADGTYTVRLDVPPGHDAGSIDMLGKLSTQWNARTLTLMAGAGLIQLCGVQSQAADSNQSSDKPEWHPFQTVRILNLAHLEPETWAGQVDSERLRVQGAQEQNLEALKRFVVGQECAAEILAPLYQVEGSSSGRSPLIPVGRACGGCPACRRKRSKPWVGLAAEPVPPWPPSELSERLTSLLFDRGRLLVFLDRELLWDASGPGGSARERRRLWEAIGRLVDWGLAGLVVLSGVHVDLEFIQGQAAKPLFVADELAFNGLPKGPKVVFARTISATSFSAERTHSDGRIFFLPCDCPDPERGRVHLVDTYPGQKMDLARFLEVTR
jgi:superfamily II DNA/RNA helicase